MLAVILMTLLCWFIAKETALPPTRTRLDGPFVPYCIRNTVAVANGCDERSYP